MIKLTVWTVTWINPLLTSGGDGFATEVFANEKAARDLASEILKSSPRDGDGKPIASTRVESHTVNL